MPGLKAIFLNSRVKFCYNTMRNTQTRYMYEQTMKIVTGLAGICFKNGYDVLQEKGFAIVCMSPGNSYFKENIIYELLRTASEIFSKVLLLIPDQPAGNTYLGLGHSLVKAQRLARLKGNNLKNHARRAIEKIVQDGGNQNIIIPDWDNDIAPQILYKKYRTYIYDLYRDNEEFKNDARATTRDVISKQVPADISVDAAIDSAVNYLLEELAYILAVPEIFGVAKITYVYHKRWPIFEDLVNGKYGSALSHIGFMIVAQDVT